MTPDERSSASPASAASSSSSIDHPVDQPGTNVLSSLRRTASQFFQNLTPARKRKVAAKALAAGNDSAAPPAAPSQASPSPSRKRARIAAPDALGREESRKLVALLDQATQPKFGPEMMEKLEKERLAAIVRPRLLDPAEEMRDDAEIEEALLDVGPQTPINSGAQHTTLTEAPSADDEPRDEDISLGAVSPAPPLQPETLSDPMTAEAPVLDRALTNSKGLNGHTQMDDAQTRLPLTTPTEGGTASDVSRSAEDHRNPSRTHTPEMMEMSQDGNLPEGTEAVEPAQPHAGDVSFEAELSARPAEAFSGMVDQGETTGHRSQANSVDPTGPALSSPPLVSADALTEQVLPVEAETLLAEQKGLQSPEASAPSTTNAGQYSPRLILDVSNGQSQPASPRRKTSATADKATASTGSLSPLPSLTSPRETPRSRTPQGRIAANSEIIDFTKDSDSENEEEEGILLTPQGSGRLEFSRQPSRGLLAGPLTKTPSARMRQGATGDQGSRLESGAASPSGATNLIRQMGRVSLGRSANFDVSLASGSAYTPSRLSQISHTSFVTDGSRLRPKRSHIREKEHRQQLQQVRRSVGGASASPLVRRQSPAALASASPALRRDVDYSVDDPQGLASYRQLLARTLGPRATGTSASQGRLASQNRLPSVVAGKARDTTRQRNFELLLQKSRYAQSKIAVPPSKELLRLRREEKARERKRRGILGRKPLPPLLEAAQEEIVQDALHNPGWKSSITGASATHRDILKLQPGSWINDEVITFYMTMINQRSAMAEEARKQPNHDRRWNAFYRVHAFNSHFWAKLDTAGYQSVSRWTRKVDIFSKDIVLVPCNLGGSHWTCAAINFRRGRIEYYDSLAGENDIVTAKLRQYLRAEMKDKGKTPAGTGIDVDSLTEYFASSSSPQQRNGHDCGVFVCATLEQLSRRDPHYPFAEDPEPDDDEDDEDWVDDEDDGGAADDPVDIFGGRGRNLNGRGAPKNAPRTGVRSGGYEWNFGQDNMPYLRKRIIFEIAQRKLLD
ncbi:unnamed protein product [Parajaminaea phylloscopi]